jgi:class 3 adenylate cyclase
LDNFFEHSRLEPRSSPPISVLFTRNASFSQFFSPAVLAALSAQKNQHPLAGFQMGVGIATGRAIACKIGTADQVKLTVFGPIVNLASRLEGMTKILHAPILVDETTAE